MAFDYTKTRATAERLIARFGQDVTLTKRAKYGEDWNPTLIPTGHTVKAVDLNTVNLISGSTAFLSRVQSESTRTLLVSTSAGVNPSSEDTVTINSVEHKISEVRPLSPGGIVLMFEVDLAA